ncbi:hypothetical protein ACLOJK_014040 [Asimina triloba]
MAVAPAAIEMDSGEKRLNDLGYKQQLRRKMVDDMDFSTDDFGYKQQLRRKMVDDMDFSTDDFGAEQTLFKALAISVSTVTLYTGITPLYGSSLLYSGPASLVWGWLVVAFFSCFIGFAMAEICSSFPNNHRFLLFLGCPFSQAKVGPLRFTVLCLAGDYRSCHWRLCAGFDARKL